MDNSKIIRERKYLLCESSSKVVCRPCQS